MDQLNRVPEVTEHVLSGLKADHRLKHQILEAAVSSPGKTSFRPRPKTIIALCSLSVLLVLLGVFVSALNHNSSSGNIRVIPAGNRRNSSPVNLQTVIEKASDLIQDQITEAENP